MMADAKLRPWCFAATMNKLFGRGRFGANLVSKASQDVGITITYTSPTFRIEQVALALQ
jgi:hypothetical protein